LPRSSSSTPAAEALYALATACARSVVVVGTAKNAGKTTTFNALRAVARRRGTLTAVTSIGRDGEPSDALDAQPKPRVRLDAGTLVALPAGLVPRSPALALLERGEESALGTIMFARAMLTTTCEIAGPPTARAMRATIDRLRALGDGPVLVDGAIDRIAPLAGGGDAIVVATGAASGKTVARVAEIAADTVARLTLPGRDAARERATVVRIAGALDARDAEELLHGSPDVTVVVDDPTRVAVRGAVFVALRAFVDLRCERPLRVVACTTSPVARDASLPARALVEAVARATGLPAFDVVADLTSGVDD
jgi:hypothetical protein